MIRKLALMAVACLLASGCGIQMRTPAAPVTTTITASVSPPSATPREAVILPPVNVEPLELDPGQTVVTITFDDGRASNVKAAQILNAYGLRGTFFINSGTIGKPGYLSLTDLDWIATTSGNEIGGHTVDHRDLRTLNTNQVRSEICDDRATLMGWGFPVRNFAYPFASASPEIEAMVRECGYNSGRSLGELWGVRPPPNTPPEQNCAQCDAGESVPPGDPFYTRAPAQVNAAWTTEDFEQQVEAAVIPGDGWVQLTFHGLCPTDCSDITTPVTMFTEFVIWLADQQAQGRLVVLTVGEVIGGPVQPPGQATP